MANGPENENNLFNRLARTIPIIQLYLIIHIITVHDHVCPIGRQLQSVGPNGGWKSVSTWRDARRGNGVARIPLVKYNTEMYA